MPKKPKGPRASKSSAAPKKNPPSAPPPTPPGSPAVGPVFAEPQATPDPTRFRIQHASDKADYAILDKEPHLPPLPFPLVPDTPEPVLLYQDVLTNGEQIEALIIQHKQIVFHAVGDTGNTRSTGPQNLVADKMVSDYDDQAAANVPAFLYHLGDVVYSFGEREYYYDQFYDPYREYPAPIFAIAGNHDGMVAPTKNNPTLEAFLENFCAAGQPWHTTPDAGGLPRTAMIQPGVYFTLEAPFVRILGVYSNRLEDPGIISSQGGQNNIGDTQLTFLQTALQRIADEKFPGAVIIAVHHPPYSSGGIHSGSPRMLQDIDAACKATGVWPHAVLSGHAHNYQRFTRVLHPGKNDQMQIPFVIGGNGGHAVNRLTPKGAPALRTPLRETAQELKDGSDTVTLESYDDQDYGYLRVIVDAQQLRIEYHPQSDGSAAKTPDDAVTVNLQSRQIVHYLPANANAATFSSQA